MKEEIESKDAGGRVKERGVNNNSLYDSFVENERRTGKVKYERSRSLEGDGSGCLRTNSSLVSRSRSGNMGSPSHSPSRSGSPGGGRSENRYYLIDLGAFVSHPICRSRSGISPPKSDSGSPNSSPQRYSRSRRSRHLTLLLLLLPSLNCQLSNQVGVKKIKKSTGEWEQGPSKAIGGKSPLLRCHMGSP